jgi:hypothetical protein
MLNGASLKSLFFLEINDNYNRFGDFFDRILETNFFNKFETYLPIVQILIETFY